MEELVMVPVPASRVLDVYELLGSKKMEPPASALAAEDGSGSWDAAAFQRHILGRSKTIRGLVSFLADQAGKEVTTEQAATALKLPYGWNSLAGALGALGTYCSNRNLSFPWESWEDTNGHTVMRMSKSVAAEAQAAGL